MITPVLLSGAIDKGKVDLGFLRRDPESWGKAEDISIDYEVMERAAVPFLAGWSDLGG